MDKDRTMIAKGTPRNRHLVPLNDIKDKKRILYYTSKKMAEAAFSNGLGFYEWNLPESQRYKRDGRILQAVEVEMIIREVE